MRKVIGLAAVLVACLLVPVGSARGHGGGLAADGCHMDRKTGTRHCHRGPNAGATTAPVRLTGGGTAREVYYPNCAAARAAGAAPVRRGQPGYARHLDRDGDGVGCE
jgi:hypothetical protein